MLKGRGTNNHVVNTGDKKMRFLIVGPGAMGCLFAARLKMAGFEVVLQDKHEERALEINKKGIRVEGVTGEYRVKVRTNTGKPPLVPDVVLICVKSYDTLAAAQILRPWIEPKARILTLQNGVGNIEMLQEIFDEQRILGGVTAEGATVLGPGSIRHAGQGETMIGPVNGPDNAVTKIVNAFNKAGFVTKAIEDVENLIWGKLIINVGINALAAITGLKNGLLPKFSGTRIIMEQAVNEAVSVARTKGITLPYSDPLGRVIEVCQATSGNVASMLQDVLNKKMTEIEFINGAIVREGKARGIATPVNSTLTHLVKTLQETYAQRSIS